MKKIAIVLILSMVLYGKSISIVGTDEQNTYATFYSIMAEEIDEKKELTPGEKDGRLTVIH